MEVLQTALLDLHSNLVLASVPGDSSDFRDEHICLRTAEDAAAWKRLVELSHKAQDACRDVANTQAFVRNRQKKLEDAVDHLRVLVCPNKADASGGDGEAASALQSPMGIVAAVESKLEQLKLEEKLAQGLLCSKTEELEALQNTSQKTLQELTAMYKARLASVNEEYESRISEANRRAELARVQSTGLMGQLDSCMEKLKNSENSRRTERAESEKCAQEERLSFQERLEHLEQRLEEVCTERSRLRSQLIECEAAKLEAEEASQEMNQRLNWYKTETREQLVALSTDIDSLEAEVTKQNSVAKIQSEQSTSLKALLDLREAELKNCEEMIADKDRMLSETRTTFSRHKRVWENETAALKGILDEERGAREKAELEVRHLQVEKISEALTQAGCGNCQVDSCGDSSSLGSQTPSGGLLLSLHRHEDQRKGLRLELDEKLRLKDLEIDSLKEALLRRQMDLDLACSLLSTMNQKDLRNCSPTMRKPSVLPASQGVSQSTQQRLMELENALERTESAKDDAEVLLSRTKSELEKCLARESASREELKSVQKVRSSLESQLKHLAKGTLALYSALEESKQKSVLASFGDQLKVFEPGIISLAPKLDQLLLPLKSLLRDHESEQRV